MSAPVACERLAGLPPYGEVLDFHQPGETFVREGVVFEFHVDGRSWVGNFSPGMGPRTAVHVVGSTAYVIAEGNGYGFRLAAPAEYQVLRPGLITDSRLIDGPNILVLAGLVDVSAYGEGGLLWTTPRLSMDGLRLQECSATIITGVAERVGDGAARYFTIDPASGRSAVGAPYP